MTAQLIIRSRRPPQYARRLQEVLVNAGEAIFDRHATEADFFHMPELESEAGPINAVGESRSMINVSATYDLNAS